MPPRSPGPGTALFLISWLVLAIRLPYSESQSPVSSIEEVCARLGDLAVVVAGARDNQHLRVGEAMQVARETWKKWREIWGLPDIGGRISDLVLEVYGPSGRLYYQGSQARDMAEWLCLKVPPVSVPASPAQKHTKPRPRLDLWR